MIRRPSGENVLEPYCSECGPQAGSITIAWKLVRDAAGLRIRICIEQDSQVMCMAITV